MTREEFEAMQQDLQKQLWPDLIEVDDNSGAGPAIGCYFDNSHGEWVVYKNDEFGWQSERLRTKKEEEAFDELFSIIEVTIKIRQHYVETENKSKSRRLSSEEEGK